MIALYMANPEVPVHSTPSRYCAWVQLLLFMAATIAGCSAGPEPDSAAGRAYLGLATRSIEPEPRVSGIRYPVSGVPAESASARAETADPRRLQSAHA